MKLVITKVVSLIMGIASKQKINVSVKMSATLNVF